MKLYGISNCGTVKKARTWLAEHGQDIPFHDFKKEGIDRALIARWLRQVGWQELINRRGTTWRRLSDIDQAAITSEASAINLMLEKPSVIRRPILEAEHCLLVGFDEQTYSENFRK